MCIRDREQAALDAPQDEEELLTAAVNRTILEGFEDRTSVV